MKTMTRLLWIVVIALMMSCSSDVVESEINDTSNDLSLEEKNDLIHLREEEKLARDVYLYAYDKYTITIAKNISLSEQTHMDKVLEIVHKYGLEDNVSDTPGVFHIAELQTLYDQLITTVDSSEQHALIVGATIEDLDIKDIEHFMERTTNEDILSMYSFLMCGSRNHLRSYNAQLVSLDVTYSPQFITQSQFDEIVYSDKEMCGL